MASLFNVQRQLLRALVLAALVVGLLPQVAPGQPARADGERPSSHAEARFPAFTGMENSSRSEKPVILHGRLSDPSGGPLGEAEVLLSAEPSLAAKRAMKIGDSYELVPVARTVTAEDGSYTLRAALDAKLQMRHDREGLDLELDVFTKDRHLVYFTQAAFDPGTGGWSRTNLSAVVDKPGPGANAGNREDIVLDPAVGATLPEDVEWPEGEQPTARHHQGQTCSSWTLYANRTPRETVSTAIARNGVSIAATYTSTATTSSGTGWAVAKSGDWTGVSYSQSGTKSRTSTFTAGFSRQDSSAGTTIEREYRVEYRHRVLDRHCYIGCLVCPHVWELQRQTEPDAATGGAGAYSSRYSNFSCQYAGTRVGPGVSKVSTTSATATTYGSAFSITAGATFNGTARSGYDSNTKITYLFNTSNGGYWCGNDNYPASAGRTKAWR